MSNLYLIATRHDDLVLGPEKLLRVYDRIKPDILLSEMHETDFPKPIPIIEKFRYDLNEFTQDQEGLDEFIGVFSRGSIGGFEYPTNQSYSRDHRTPNYLIGMPGSLDRLFFLGQESIDNILETIRHKGKFNPRKLASYLKKNFGNPLPKETRDLWNQVKRDENSLFGEIRLLFHRIVTQRIGKPDKYMEERIREIYDPKKVIAFPVGMLHATDSISYSTLYSRLKDLHPERIPLLN
jgi:hypothetical protein